MMQRDPRDNLTRRGIAAVSAVGSAFASPAMAALPTAVEPSTGPAAGDWLGLVQGYIKDGGVILGLAISVIGFLWVSWHALSKFNECRQGRAEWGELGLLGVAAGATLLVVTFFLTTAASII